MAKYFTISSGLRGCYLPDSLAIIRIDTRRELRGYIENEAENWRGGGAAGLSKAAISTFAAECWREAQKKRPAYLPFCLPIKPRGASNYSSGLFASVATRAEYLEYLKAVEAD